MLDPWAGYWIYTYVNDVTLVFNDEPSRGESFSSSANGFLPLGPPTVQEESDATADLRVPSAIESVSVINAPNPIRGGYTTTFLVQGICLCRVSGLMVSVYGLDGRLVWEGRTTGPELEWNTISIDGERVLNGMYIYLSQVNVDGQWIPVEAGKLAVLR